MDEYIKRQDAIDAYEKASISAERIRSIPSADVAPVVHGKWKRIDYEPYGHDYVCSMCNQMNDRASHYCPDCGAKMDL